VLRLDDGVFNRGIQQCINTQSLHIWILTLAPCNRNRSEIFFAVTGVGLDFVFAEETLLVVSLTFICVWSNSSQMGCIMLMLIPHPDRIRIEDLRNSIWSGIKKIRVRAHAQSQNLCSAASRGERTL